MSGLKAADLFVRVGVSLREFDSGMAKMLSSIKKISNQVAELSGKMASVSTLVAAPFLGAIAAASKMDSQVGAAVGRIKDTFGTFALEIGRAFLPSLQSMGDSFLRLLGIWQGLDDKTKQNITSIGSYAIGVAAASKAIQMFAQVSSSMAGALELIAKGLGAMGLGGGLAGIAAAVLALGGLYLLVGALKIAWDNWGDSIKGVAGILRDELSTAVTQFKADMEEMFRSVTQTLAKLIRAYMAVKDSFLFTPFSEQGKKDKAEQMAKLESMASSLESSSLSKIATQAAALAKSAGSAAVDGIKASADAAKEVFGSLIDGIKDLRAMLDNAPKGELSVSGGKSIEQILGEGKWKDDSKPFATNMPVAGDYVHGGGGWGNAQAAGEMLGSSVMSSQPVLQNVAQGAATGGWIGAIAGLLASSEQFQLLMDKLGVMLQELANVCGKLIEPLFPLVDSLMSIVGIVMDALGPILQMVALCFVQLAPLLDMIGMVLKPILDVIGTILTPVLKALFYVFKGFAVVVGAIVIAVGGVWNAIIAMVAEIAGIFSQDWKNELYAKQMDVNGMSKALGDIWNMQIADAQDMTDSSVKAARGLDTLSESLNTLNVPQGFKTAQYMFDAIDVGPRAIMPALPPPAEQTITVDLPELNVNVKTDTPTTVDFDWRNTGALTQRLASYRKPGRLG